MANDFKAAVPLKALKAFGVLPAERPDPLHHEKDECGKAKTEQPDLSIHKTDAAAPAPPELTPES
jgi:hypothetical protein